MEKVARTADKIHSWREIRGHGTAFRAGDRGVRISSLPQRVGLTPKLGPRTIRVEIVCAVCPVFLGDWEFESISLQRRVSNEPGRRLRPIVRIAETLGYESQNAFARTLGGSISRHSCRKKAPARCKNSDDPPADAAAISSAALSCPSRTGVLLMRSLPVRSSPFLAQCSSCTSTMPARTAVRNTTWSRSVPFRGSSGLAVVNAGA
jgi:hypothetical protein